MYLSFIEIGSVIIILIIVATILQSRKVSKIIDEIVDKQGIV
jgi:hypothetical protein